MRIVVWQGCQIIREIEIIAPGPDIQIDPWNDLIGCTRNLPGGEEISYDTVPYWLGLRHQTEQV